MSIEIGRILPAITPRKRAAILARGMLSGEISFLAGATELTALRHQLSTPENDRDFQIFEAIASQFGGLTEEPAAASGTPIVWEKQTGITACQSLVRRFHN